jgi:hypothetical protein
VVASSSAFERTPTPSPEYNSSKTMSHKVLYQSNQKRIVRSRTIIRNGIVNEGATNFKVMDNKTCPEYGVCEKYMSSEVSFIGNGASNIKNGFVKDDVTFLVMDDLLIQPMSTVSSTITLLNNLNIKEIGTFQEKVVEMGMDEVRFSNFCISILIYKFRFSCIFCSILNRESRCLKLLCNRRWS